MPGGAICSFLTFNAAINTDNTFQKLCGMFLSMIAYANTAYYGKLAIENHTERKMQDNIKNK